ncbi:MAG: restriction endonuclease [Candidatus Binatus sp.]|uniref:restriction endonuclease n=1 Tax=Candidatus Binatus sp. TaxID=2811406 RepID=UPI002717144B|nr:restriction endonuclease [Candidatus Binatus sp.]MDO8434385.1 restriction endonuclease [Candidatus Binatus sp.]
MAIPDFQTLMLPVLKTAGSDEVSIGDVITKLADDFKLSEDERNQMLPSGHQTTLANRIGWAKPYLAKAGLLEATKRGYFRITNLGSGVLSAPPSRIDISFLRQYPKFEEFRSGERNVDGEKIEQAVAVLEQSSQTPDELLRATHQEIEKSLQTDLLDRVIAAPPSFFETLIVSVLMAMGYGGFRDEAGRAIGKTGDGGLDGVIDQDPLGLDRVYVQAKRYKRDLAVSEPEIRGFAGSLESVKATKGVFVTTSYFTAPASAFVEKIARRIVLIDGHHLARLMVKYNVGVRIEETLHIKKIDEDYFVSD